MSQNTLLLLGLLRSQSRHGYELFDFIERNYASIAALKKPTAYALLDRLHRDHLIEVRIEQEGNRPPRKVYELTTDGEREFQALLRSNLSSATEQSGSGDVALMFLDQLPVPERRACLERRLFELETRIMQLERVPDHAHVNSVNYAIEQQLTLLQADRDWHAQLLEHLTAP